MKVVLQLARSAAMILTVAVMFGADADAQSFRSQDQNSLLSTVPGSASSTDTFSVSRYVIQGIVLDDQGVPVEGAALRIGRQVAYTDTSGRFVLRLSRRASYPFTLAPDEFMTNGVYQVISAPSEVHSESEENAKDVQVLVRRVPPPQARLYNQ